MSRLAASVVVLLLSPLAVADEPAKAPADAAAPVKPHPITPPTPEEINSSINRGIEFLLGDQNKDGSWGTAQRTKDLNIYAPVPGAHQAFRSADTALCVMALIESGGDNPRVQAAIDRGGEWLIENLPHLRRATPDAIYNIWGHGYGIQALVRLLRRAEADPDRQERLRALIAQQIDMLSRYESVDGGWGYYDFRAGTKRPTSSSTSFMSAAVLIGLDEARQAGVALPDDMVKRAIASIKRQQKPDFTYIYGEYLKYVPQHPVNQAGGSLGRTQVCNLALRTWGDAEITDKLTAEWLDRLFARNGWLDIGRKRPVPHESWYAVAGYFFYFGHYYAALSLEKLPAEQQPHFQDHLAHIVLALQEKDGSWWDYPLYNYHQQYGTSFAVMTLLRCRKP